MWKTILQKRVALSTAEAEYRAATYACKDVLWLRNLLKELGRGERYPTRMYEDNSACVKMVNNPVISKRNKYIEIDCHFIRDHVNENNIEVVKIAASDQRADLLTKNLPNNDFKKFTNLILHTPSLRGTDRL